MGQLRRVGAVDVSGVSLPPRRETTSAELGLVVVAGYESDLRMHTAEAKRRFHAVRVLSGVALLVFAYDVLSLLLGR